MDLWIKSQNGDLSKIIDLEQPIICDNRLAKIHGYSQKRYVLLGTYETEQRSLEVLEDIRAFKDFLQYVELLPNNKKWEYLQKVDFKNGDSLTYEMPKE